ncbi:hypothetical protein EMIHUDRAFT_422285 [Emiliania huxleyi CCMP1516]|uniref:Protein kinase domain-containing protein n=2 Tax=Emiliania huxleyi TaxID=2903 RepID=A0A0D3II78_EMIH1|nr:hypothetical protein EMIHUDRAFT_422285 [Emiliania huxleyi CCMP1516]EOD10963.1 hypothetical protein EMIHUDRAFT_422285 [Emiliania huxleyi CCMP1516]|eukprot:XP_005763392.1 hypothetical protein EMIHUDRAFT_422285 [Emiliania huxleyi CCMP1516]
MAGEAETVGGWRIAEELGSGHFAKVKRGIHITTNKQCAIKIVKKPADVKMALVQTEVDILKKVNHPYIVRCYDVIEKGDRIYFFMELMEGGELFDKIVEIGNFTESDAIKMTIKLLSALQHLHSLGASLDTSWTLPRRFLHTSSSTSTPSVMQTPCGTPGYIAPEAPATATADTVLRMRGYDKSCDVWSLGVIVYILLCGFPPFYADNDAQLYEKIKRGEFEFLRPYWDPISLEAKDMVRRMLTVDPKKRITCEEAMQHPWLRSEASHLTEEIATVRGT